MRRLGLILLILCAVALPALAEDWTTADGKVYKNVVVIAQEDNGVRITYTGGVGIIPYYELPLDLQKRFGEDYDSLMAKRSAAEKALDEATRKADAAAAEQQKQLDAAAAAAAAAQQNNPQTGSTSSSPTGSSSNPQSNSQPGTDAQTASSSSPAAQNASASSATGSRPSAASGQPGSHPSTAPGQPASHPATAAGQTPAHPGNAAPSQSQAVQLGETPSPSGTSPATAPVEYSYPGSKITYDEGLDVCYLDSPTVKVDLIVLEAAPNASSSPGQRATLMLRTTTEGRKPEMPDRIQGAFSPGGDASKISKSPKVKFLVDGTYIPAGEPEADDPPAISPSSPDTITFYLTPEQMKLIFLGKKVNFSVGTNDYRVDDAGIESFRAYLVDIDHLPPASTNVVRAYHRFIERLPSIVTVISTVCEYIILGSFTIVLAASIAAFVMGLTRFIKM